MTATSAVSLRRRRCLCSFPLVFHKSAKCPPKKRNSLIWRVWSHFWKDFLERMKNEAAAKKARRVQVEDRRRAPLSRFVEKLLRKHGATQAAPRLFAAVVQSHQRQRCCFGVGAALANLLCALPQLLGLGQRRRRVRRRRVHQVMRQRSRPHGRRRGNCGGGGIHLRGRARQHPRSQEAAAATTAGAVVAGAGALAAAAARPSSPPQCPRHPPKLQCRHAANAARASASFSRGRRSGHSVASSIFLPLTQ
jgi:hypothetical protein